MIDSDLHHERGALWLSLPDLSVQLYSVRQPLAEDFAGTLRLLTDLGLTRVEPYGMLRFADDLQAALPATGFDRTHNAPGIGRWRSGGDRRDCRHAGHPDGGAPFHPGGPLAIPRGHPTAGGHAARGCHGWQRFRSDGRLPQPRLGIVQPHRWAPGARV